MDDFDPVLLGRRVRRQRLWRGLSLQELAARAGLSKGFLSRIENGKTTPSAMTVGQLCVALGLRAGDLIHLADASTPALQPAASAGTLMREAGGGLYSLPIGAERADATLQPCLYAAQRDQMPAHAPPQTAEGETYLYVTEGRLQVRVGPREYDLGPGDSLLFDATEPHHLRPLTESARWLGVHAAPPRRQADRQDRPPAAAADPAAANPILARLRALAPSAPATDAP